MPALHEAAGTGDWLKHDEAHSADRSAYVKDTKTQAVLIIKRTDDRSQIFGTLLKDEIPINLG